MSVKTLVTQEICDEITELGKMELGTETSKAAINGVGVLMDKAIDLEKLEIERQKIELEAAKVDIERDKVELDKKDRKIKNRITIGTAAAGAGITTKPGNKFVDRALNYFFKKQYVQNGGDLTRSLLFCFALKTSYIMKERYIL